MASTDLTYKRQLHQFLYCLFFGYLGLFYSSKLLAIFGLVVHLSIMFSVFYPSLHILELVWVFLAVLAGIAFSWPLAFVAGWLSVNEYNKGIAPLLELEQRKQNKPGTGEDEQPC